MFDLIIINFNFYFLNISDFSETFRSSPVIVSQHIKPSKNSENRDYKKVFSIEEHLNDKYVSINTVDLKWPFIGHRFNDVQWKSGVKYGDDDVKTILQVYIYKKKKLKSPSSIIMKII